MMTLDQITTKYPIQNPVWRYYEGASAITKWDSDGDDSANFLDPWNRDMTATCVIERDTEGDILAWHYVTTVEGSPVDLTVFND